MSGKKRVVGLCVLCLGLAVACGNTGQNQHGGQAGAAPVAGAAGSSGSGGDASSSGSSMGGSGADSAGSSALGGEAPTSGGEGGESPVVSTPRVEIVRDKVPNKLDLLMMIDNSISMGDKQHLLADAMEHLVSRLVQPRCLDEQGSPTGSRSSPNGVCPAGSHPEFLPFMDIHAAVVTSSLGSHGATGATDVCADPTDDDHAQLLGVLRPGLTSWNQKGFLAWDPDQKLAPAGIADPAVFAAGLAAHVQAAGDHGCGYEGVLEAWYRFLVDPEPPAGVTREATAIVSTITGTSAEVLSQRRAFLRPDSVLGIVMLSDENDCSIVDEGYGWLIARGTSAPVTQMYRSTSQCLANPNDACCQSCGESTAKSGCPELTSDAECVKGETLAAADDHLNLRCYAQKQRFGLDLLYPTQRYVDALTQVQIRRRSDDALVPNPIYESSEGAQPRSPEQVLLLGIVGVPWQDVADERSLTEPGRLTFLSEEGQLSEDRWRVILGDPSASPPVLPTDPFMVETTSDRTKLPIDQSNPIVPSEKLVDSASQNPRANHINGHETSDAAKRDLQFACTFPLATPITCDTAVEAAGGACDCFASDLAYNSSLCQPPGGGAPTITQHFGKAYPGLRELQVLRGVGGHGIVASTCPKTADAQSATYGYRPAMDALAGRVARQIGRSCLSQDAHADGEGRTACSVITASSSQACGCSAEQGLLPAGAAAKAAALKELASVGYCGPGMSCDSLCVCELGQLDGANLSACQTADQPPSTPGFCYLNAVPGEVNVGSAALARDCVGASPRRVRFTGGAPAESSIALLYCPD